MSESLWVETPGETLLLLYEGFSQVMVVDLPYLALVASFGLAAARMRHQAVKLATKAGALWVDARGQQAGEDVG
jgi:hypothetical protein